MEFRAAVVISGELVAHHPRGRAPAIECVDLSVIEDFGANEVAAGGGVAGLRFSGRAGGTAVLRFLGDRGDASLVAITTWCAARTPVAPREVTVDS